MKPATSDSMSPLSDGRQSARARDIARGATRALAQRGFRAIPEVSLADGRRADLMAVDEAGEIWIVEIKSSLADFRTDTKWPGYRVWCDRLLFAVATDFPQEVLPPDTGLVLADRYGGDIVREAPEHRLAGARRKAMMLRLARVAAGRLMTLADPEAAYEPLPRE
ncbi:MAG: MmcB family DNA repair protein [Hyphomicrobiaceae bacterium]|nr:MmcB family DNA repair protein [Hyphomicrobiaceae bacterium]